MPQGGPSTPGFFGNYTVDLPMSKAWKKGEGEDRKEIRRAERELSYWYNWSSRKIISKEKKTPEDLWDMYLMKMYKYKKFMMRKNTQIGPERRQVEEYEVSERDTIFADAGSHHESENKMRILKDKSETMVSDIENLMIANRLPVNTGKTQLM